MVFTPVIHGLQLIYRPWRDGRLSWPGWLTHIGLYQRSGYMSSTDQAQITDSPPAKDGRPDH